MKKLLLMLAVVGMIGAGCKKDDDTQPDNRQPCEINQTGIIIFSSHSSNPYYCYVDGLIKGTCFGNGYLNVTVSKGFHTVRVLQQSGYIFTPTDQSSSVTVTECYEYTMTFP